MAIGRQTARSRSMSRIRYFPSRSRDRNIPSFSPSNLISAISWHGIMAIYNWPGHHLTHGRSRTRPRGGAASNIYLAFCCSAQPEAKALPCLAERANPIVQAYKIRTLTRTGRSINPLTFFRDAAAMKAD
jgi:hypothetical protein